MRLLLLNDFLRFSYGDQLNWSVLRQTVAYESREQDSLRGSVSSRSPDVVARRKESGKSTTAVDDIAVSQPTPASKHLRFAPSQIRRSSALIHFDTGVTQEIFGIAPREYRRNGRHLDVNGREDIMKGGEKLWSTTKQAAKVTRLEVPIGGSLHLFHEGGGKEFVMKGMGDDCSGEGVCERLESARLEQDVLIGLDQMSLADPSESLTMSIPSSASWPSHSVTLITQFTLSRLPRFEQMAKEWQGPLSIAIYLTDFSDIELLRTYLIEEKHLSIFRKVALTIVKPDYSISEEALRTRLRYPINKLRNLALQIAPTDYVLVVDVDFVPSPHMHEILVTRGIPLIQYPSAPPSSPTLRKTAVVISAFILSPSHTGESYPSTPAELASLLSSNPPQVSLTDKNAGHGPSLPSLLFANSTPKRVRPYLINSSPFPPSEWSYEVCYEPQWEPYYLLHRASHPLYDERFTDQGGDKQSHALLMNALGYEFKVLRDVWFLHPAKQVGKEAEIEGWPSARLVQQKGEGDQRGGELDPSHFSVGQSEKNRFRYFEDFIPEMERIWGGNFRAPKGCSARLVGWRSFGKVKGGAVFGL